MHSLVSAYRVGDQAGVRLGYAILPAVSLVEDPDGIRYLITDDPRIWPDHWERAYRDGAVGILLPGPHASRWIAADDFVATRRSFPDGSYVVPDGAWSDVAPIPTANDLLVPKQAQKRSGDFVSVHSHSEFSPLDGLSTIPEMVALAAADDQPGLAITDHGVCAAHPQLQAECDKAGLQAIFGIEANFVDDRRDRTPEHLYDYFHLCLWAETSQGLKNLWAASTEANATGFYGRSRMDWEILERYGEGLMASTGCLRGPLAKLLLEGKEDRVNVALSRLMRIFDGRLWVELQTNGLPEQIELNKRLVMLARRAGLPLVAATDTHYPTRDHCGVHEAWVAAQTGKGLTDDKELFSGGASYHMHSAQEVREALAYLDNDVVDEAMGQTLAIAERAKARIEKVPPVQVFSRQGGVEEDQRKLVQMCRDAWEQRLGDKGKDPVYEQRFADELELIISKGICWYFLMVADYCLDPSTPVLTEDLRWVEVGKLEVGDKLAGFDEHRVVKRQKGHRYWHSSKVVNTRRIVLPTCKVLLADGTETITSEDHQWLVACPSGTAIRWIATRDLKVGQRPQRLVSEWDEPNTWEAGYLAGILDGEGSLSLSKINNGGHSLSLGFAQKEGVVLETALRILDSWGFNYSLKDHGKERNGLWSVWLRGGRAEVLRLLGMVRPQRLLAKLDVDLLGRIISIDSPAIVSVEQLGLGEVVALETTTGTLVAQGFAHHNCRWARDQGILVGPGRGSSASSIVAYLLGITGVDPVKHGLLFERFLTPGREELPDFDVDFPTSKREELTAYLQRRWGKEKVVRVGTQLRLKNRGVFRDVARVLKGSEHEVGWVDVDTASAIIKDAEAHTAGLGLSWDELWVQAGDQLQPLKDRYPRWFELAEAMVGRLKSYGKHAAGLIISLGSNLHEHLPMRRADEGEPMITEFDMRAMEILGFVKFDLLTLRTLDTLQRAIDLIKQRHGIIVDPSAWTDEQYDDPCVWSDVCAGKTLGLFQIETRAGTRMVRDFQPRDIEDLAAVVTLVRPGPMRSGLTGAYLNRRAGKEAISYPDPRLKEILEPTLGAMIYQEQVLQACRILGGYTWAEADKIRKILGKKLVEEAIIEGDRFVSRCVEQGMERQAAKAFWDQIVEFARYAFNKSHAVSYSYVTHWTAWMRTFFVPEMFTSLMSTVKVERIPEFVPEAQKEGLPIAPPDINVSGLGFAIAVDQDQIVLRYGLDAVKGVGDASVAALTAAQPFSSVDDLLARKGKANIATVKLLARAGALDCLAPNRAGLERYLEDLASGLSVQCVHKDLEACGPNDLPCTFDWTSEPVPIGKRGLPIKAKPVPKKCTKACRHYCPPSPVSVDEIDVPPLTPAQVREREMDLLGLYLSSTPFDRLDPQDRETCLTGERAEDAPLGTHMVAGIVRGVRQHTDRSGRQMAFLSLFAQDGDLDVVVFADAWARYSPDVRVGDLSLSCVRKTDRGFSLVAYAALP